MTNPFLAEFFEPAITFVKEVRFYSDIIPALEEFEQTANVPAEERLDSFIRCIGWRFSLNPSELNMIYLNLEILDINFNSKFTDAEYADSDAILLLENVKFQNFTNRDKRIGFNTNETFAILKVFHILTHETFGIFTCTVVNSFSIILTGTGKDSCIVHCN